MGGILMHRYGFEFATSEGYEATLSAVKKAFKAEGFGVLSEIDVQKTLDEKIGAKIDRYTILGVCNPNLANKAISNEPNVGLMLPCNVLIREEDGKIHVSAQDPAVLMQLISNPKLDPMSKEARLRIDRAMEALQTRLKA